MRALANSASGIGSWVRRSRTALLTVGGLGCLDCAAWIWLVPVGWVAVGLSLLLLSWLTEDQPV